jgi:RNA binding exosome subunit
MGFLSKQHEYSPPPTLLFSVSPTENKTEGHHFDTIEVIEAELQAVLNSLTELDFHDELKKLAEALGRCLSAEGDYFEGVGGQ